MTVLKGEGTHNILYGSTSINLGTRSTAAYISRPDQRGSFPTVIIAHDSTGLASWLKDLCRKLTRHGLAVVAPDLYRGAEPEADNWPTPARAQRSLIDAYSFVESEDVPWASARSVTVLAIDEGTPAGIEFVLAEPETAGLIVLGGESPDLATVPVPILGLYPAASAPADRPAHMALVTYGGVEARFMDDNHDDFDRPASLDAIERIVEFVQEASAGGG